MEPLTSTWAHGIQEYKFIEEQNTSQKNQHSQKGNNRYHTVIHQGKQTLTEMHGRSNYFEDETFSIMKYTIYQTFQCKFLWLFKNFTRSIGLYSRYEMLPWLPATVPFTATPGAPLSSRLLTALGTPWSIT